MAAVKEGLVSDGSLGVRMKKRVQKSPRAGERRFQKKGEKEVS